MSSYISVLRSTGKSIPNCLTPKQARTSPRTDPCSPLNNPEFMWECPIHSGAGFASARNNIDLWANIGQIETASVLPRMAGRRWIRRQKHAPPGGGKNRRLLYTCEQSALNISFVKLGTGWQFIWSHFDSFVSARLFFLAASLQNEEGRILNSRGPGGILNFKLRRFICVTGSILLLDSIPNPDPRGTRKKWKKTYRYFYKL